MATRNIKVISETVLSAIHNLKTPVLNLLPLVISNSCACEVTNTSKVIEQFTTHTHRKVK